MDYENIQRAQKLGGQSIAGRKIQRPKHEKNAEKKLAAFEDKISVLDSEKAKLDKQEDKYHFSKLEFMKNSNKAELREKEQKDFFEKQKEAGGNFNFRVKNKSTVLLESEKQLEFVSNHIEKQKSKVHAAVEDIAPEAGRRMIKGLSHFVNQYDIQKTEFNETLSNLREKDILTADDFKQLANINSAVIEAKADAPNVQEALRSGAKFGLTAEAMIILADENFNISVDKEKNIADELIASTAHGSILEESIVTEIEIESQDDISLTAKEDSLQQNENSDKKSFKSRISGLLSGAKLALGNSIEKLQTFISHQYEKHTELNLSDNVVNSPIQTEENSLVLDQNDEIFMGEDLKPQQAETVSINTVLSGQHPKIHSIEMEQDGVQMTISIHMSDDLLTAEMKHGEKAAYIEAHPDSFETSKESILEVGEGMNNRLHEQNFKCDDLSQSFLNKRQEPTIEGDLPEIEAHEDPKVNSDRVEIEIDENEPRFNFEETEAKLER